MHVAFPCGNIWRDWPVGAELKDQTAIDMVKAPLAGYEKLIWMVKGTSDHGLGNRRWVSLPLNPSYFCGRNRSVTYCASGCSLGSSLSSTKLLLIRARIAGSIAPFDEKKPDPMSWS